MKNLGFYILIIVCCFTGAWFHDTVSLHLKGYNRISIHDPEDVTGIDQILWNTSHGRLFQFNVQAVTGDHIDENTIFTRKNANNLASHSTFFYLFIAIFYMLLPHFSTCIILQGLFISLSGLSLYLIAKEMFSEKIILPLLIFFIYMCYPPFVNNAHYFHLEEFSIAFIFFAYYFYLKDKLLPLFIFAGLAVSCREDTALIFTLLGITSYFQPAKRKHALPLIFFGLISFFTVKFAIPRLFEPTDDAFQRHYGYLGQNGIEKLKTIFFNPGIVIHNIATANRIPVFNSIFLPVFYLPFLSPILFMPGLIILAELMLTQVTVMGMLNIYPWYICGIIPFVFIALIGTLEKFYSLDKFVKRDFPKLYSLKIARAVLKAVTFCLVLLLSSSLLFYNRQLSKPDFTDLKNYFSLNQYWDRDTLEMLSSIREKTKLSVTSPYRLLPILSSREYIMPIRYLTKSITDQGAYDLIIKSWSPETMDGKYNFDFLEESVRYKNIYSTPDMSIFAKNDASEPINNWKLDIISKIQKSSISYNYVFSNFTDFSTILDNSNAINSEELSSNIFQNKEIHYAILEPAQKTSQAQINNSQILYFNTDKPLETGDKYILTFSAKTTQGKGIININYPSRSASEAMEIKIDDKARLYMIPFQVDHQRQHSEFLMEISQDCITSAILLLNPPSDNNHNMLNIFTININNHVFIYNPWLKLNTDLIQGRQHRQFLIRYLNNNPIIFFMKLLRLEIPIDLYNYRWSDNYKNKSEVTAIRYN